MRAPAAPPPLREWKLETPAGARKLAQGVSIAPEEGLLFPEGILNRSGCDLAAQLENPAPGEANRPILEKFVFATEDVETIVAVFLPN